MNPKKLFVAGATGATGKHVVQIALEKGHSVVAVARSKETMMKHLNNNDYGDRLVIHEASILDLSHEDLVAMSKDCTAVVSCLGHNLSFNGMYRQPRKLVTEAMNNLTKAMPKSSKFILMGSDGVSSPEDDPRAFGERSVLFLLRWLLPPHHDNELAFSTLYSQRDFDWTIVRPTNLINEDKASGLYEIVSKPPFSLFGDSVVSRANTGLFMVELATNDQTFAKYKHKAPVIFSPKK